MRLFDCRYMSSGMNVSAFKAALKDLILDTEENLTCVQLGSILRSLRVLIVMSYEEKEETPLIPRNLLFDTIARLEVELMTRQGLHIQTMLHILQPVLNHEVSLALGFNNALFCLKNRVERLRAKGELDYHVSTHTGKNLNLAGG